MDDKKTALIGDFGLALRVSKEVGGTLKTWQWLAPEVISADSEGYDEKSDVFSFGIILWEIITLEIPYDEYQKDPAYFVDNLQEWKLQEVKTAIIENNLRPTIPESCPEYLKTILEGCWQRFPAERISAREIINLLEQNNEMLEHTSTRHRPGLIT